MRYIRMPLLFVGILIAYCLTATLINSEAIRGDAAKVILLAVLVFLWGLSIHPHRKYFS